jgi:predicted nucleotidyltransferase
MISNIFDKDIVKVFSFFAISPGSRHLRKEVKEKTDMNNIVLDNVLSKLLSLKVLKKEKNLYCLNLGAEETEILFKIREEYLKINVPYNVFNILAGLCDKLSKIKGIEEVYLFGSFAKLIYHEKSDIDLAVFVSEKIDKLKLEKKIKKMPKTEKIEIHVFSKEDKKEKDLLIKDILRNGKKIL